MEGAREYANMFCTGQYGRLYLESGGHARGKTFHIWVLPANKTITGHPSADQDAVEVYGIISGQPGWTETYGWLHHGKWEKDFAAMVAAKRVEIDAQVSRAAQEAAERIAAKHKHEMELLNTY